MVRHTSGASDAGAGQCEAGAHGGVDEAVGDGQKNVVNPMMKAENGVLELSTL